MAEIIESPNLCLFERAAQEADENTLVIFDVDDVLITARDQILQPAYRAFSEKLEKEIEKEVSEKEAEKLWSITWLTRLAEPVDPQMAPLLQKVKYRGVKVLALTNAWTGAFGNIPSLEDWRLNELKGFGYAFHESWPCLKPTLFKQLKPKDPDRFPVFKDGVVFTCNLPKGMVLKAFLEYAKFLPEKIVFIDDKQKHLASVESFCQKAGIRFFGFRYTAVAKRSKPPLHEKRARLQFQVLKEEQKWLSDEEADKRLMKAS